MLPFEFCQQADFDELRARLTHANYRYDVIVDSLGLSSMADIEKRIKEGSAIFEPRNELELLIFLFAEGGSARDTRIREILGDNFVELLERFRLLVDDPLRPGLRSGSVAIGPVEGLFTISDRWWAPGGEQMKVPADAVYPATAPNTIRFLSMLPRTRCKAYLDLCCGTAIAAQVAARDFAEHAWAFDIAERSTTFAEFGRLLNGLENVTIRTGDLYEPAAGRRFDYISAHPPYIPELEPKYIFQDGGEDGELIVRRVIQEAPRHMAPGGRLYIQSLTTDRRDIPAEQRFREWLGDASPACDVALFEKRLIDPGEFASRSLLRGTESYEQANSRRRMFQNLGITGFPYGLWVLQSHVSPRDPFTLRRRVGSMFSREEVAAQLDWETGRTSASSPDLLLSSPVNTVASLELLVRQTMSPQGWQEQSYRLKTTCPYITEAEVEPWIVYLLGQCDGLRTGMEIFERLQEQDILEPAVPREAFAHALAQLVSGGFLCPPRSR